MNETQQHMFKNAVSTWARNFEQRESGDFQHVHEQDKYVLIDRHEVICKEWCVHNEMTADIQSQLPKTAEALVIVEKDEEGNKCEYVLFVQEQNVIHGSIIRTHDTKTFFCYEGLFRSYILNSYSHVLDDSYPLSLKDLLQEELTKLPEYRLYDVTGSIEFINGF